MTNDPRGRMVAAAAALLSERGLSGTSFSEVVERSKAPRGSIYHHFPGGKEQLAAEAVELVGERVRHALERLVPTTPGDVARSFVALWRRSLVATEFRAGCAVAATASECLGHAELAASAATVFASWERALAAAFEASGVPVGRAAALATVALASVEGALILSRARRDTAALDAVEASLVALTAGT